MQANILQLWMTCGEVYVRFNLNFDPHCGMQAFLAAPVDSWRELYLYVIST